MEFALIPSYSEDMKCKSKPLFNFTVNEAKWQMWKNRNNVCYGKKVTKTSQQIVSEILREYARWL